MPEWYVEHRYLGEFLVLNDRMLSSVIAKESRLAYARLAYQHEMLRLLMYALVFVQAFQPCEHALDVMKVDEIRSGILNN
ncbi:hypothetical protein WI91_01120 [Burkholderia vietnamiensis]|nr:hypothetical protein WI91_01120 [Burkholderia vietnamiensis]